MCVQYYNTIVAQVYEISPDFSQVLDSILRDFAG